MDAPAQFDRTQRFGQPWPQEAVSLLAADYRQRGATVTCQLWKRSPSCIYHILNRRGLIKRKAKTDKVTFNGVRYAKTKAGYFQRTTRQGRFEMGGAATPTLPRFLHHAIWIAAHGPIPADHDIRFKNGRRSDLRLGNLECLPEKRVNRLSLGAGRFRWKTALARVEEHKGFIIKKADAYSRSYGIPIDDLIAEGKLAVIHASRLWDRSRGGKFLSYAGWWIRSFMQRYCRANHRIIRVPEHKFGKVFINEVALDKPLTADSETTLGDLLGTDEAVTEAADFSDRSEAALKALSELSPDRQTIIRLRFLENKTLDEIGAIFGVTREAIRLQEIRALRTLRHKLRNLQEAA
jgi:RNA polymerase sigma factor (sigma-70 family)